jgi:pimeloyl-ACP methyl ester carboxylesterase
MNDIRPYRIDIAQEALDDLAARLDRVRWPDDPASTDRYGVPTTRMKELVDHWRHTYDWRAQEATLNEIPQYRTEIDGTTVHFQHVRSPEPDALPLILTHGWPGSIVEFLDVIGPLSDPRRYGRDPADAFDLVIPSIPGYGLSGPTPDDGWSVQRIAQAWAVLMDQLGYRRYGAQGGDWGSGISRLLGAAAPEAVVGVHVNYLPTVPPEDVSGFSAEDQRRAAATKHLLHHPSGHTVQQSTRPLTLAYALTDSPVGQLAWIADKVAEWSDPATPISVDRLLTDVMIYWLTGTAASSSRLHFESSARRGSPVPCPVPVGVAVLPYDITQSVRPLAERMYDIVRWTEYERGGHFAALEVPDLFTADVRAFFRGLR